MKKILLALVLIIVVSGYGLFKYNNPQPEDLYSYYLNQDATPEGKTAVFMIGLATTEDYEPTWWYNIYQHVAHVNIPWPARTVATRDRGVSLVDPDQYSAREESEPSRLVDRHGSEHDVDKVPYIEKYRQGLVEWQPPRDSVHLDTGNWLLIGRADGIPTPAGKRMSRATNGEDAKGLERENVAAGDQTDGI